MKRIFALVLAIVMLFSIPGCGKNSDLVVKENGKSYIILPVSGNKARIDDEGLKLVSEIDMEMLRAADEKLHAELTPYVDVPESYITEFEGELFLEAEEIVDIDPPETSEFGDTAGCGIDHKHVYVREQITK